MNFRLLKISFQFFSYMNGKQNNKTERDVFEMFSSLSKPKFSIFLIAQWKRKNKSFHSMVPFMIGVNLFLDWASEKAWTDSSEIINVHPLSGLQHKL